MRIMRSHLLATTKHVRIFALSRALGCAAVIALLAACSSGGERATQAAEHAADIKEAAQYAARARGNYVPPGPPADPWGPYIVEASKRFDVPERWIREVMRVESGGDLYKNGQLITSWVGAMGLMQVMPGTYDELKGRHGLGDDPFEPHNNILAGAAYMREMYDVYGVPGFLAAYNAGPKRLDEYLANQRTLPDETRRYVSLIGPYIADTYPANRSPAENYAMNVLPFDIPAGLRFGGPVQRADYVRPAHSVRIARGRSHR
ncbi:MAG: lytic transglycosylase domain-containing protein, partial [Acetobacteraceae bacterium]|nr:lytic transglycosylase domain-containing protein [Acetobacteraceae bacterium]